MVLAGHSPMSRSTSSRRMAAPRCTAASRTRRFGGMPRDPERSGISWPLVSFPCWPQGGHLATRIGVPDSAYPPGDLDVVKSLAGKEILPDLDDTIGGHFQTTFWNELIGLWTSTDPAAALGPALTAIQAAVPP